MLYRPPDGKLWDTTLFRHGERFHLLHLRGGDGLGHAVSDDLIHWTPRGLVDVTGPKGAWNEGIGPWTGTVVHHDGRYALLTGGLGPDGIAGYGLLVSDDLETWTDPAGQAVLQPDGALYARTPCPLHEMHAAWRDPCVVRDEDGVFHAFLCARTPEWSADDTGAVVAHAVSEDLRHWDLRPPIAQLGDRVLFAEVPDVFRMGRWWYLLILDHGWGGTRLGTPAREEQAGTFYLRSPRLTGPYEWPDEPLLIGTDGDRIGPWAARTLAVGGERWLYFHHAGAAPALGLPKRVAQTPDGGLTLRHLPLLQAVHRPVELRDDDPAGRAKPFDLGTWRRDGAGSAGSAGATGTALPIADDLADGELTVRIRNRSAARGGAAIRVTGRPGDGLFDQPQRGLVVWLDFERGRLVAERLAWVPGFGWGAPVLAQMGHRPEPTVRQQVACDLTEGPRHLRVSFRDAFCEVYLDETWMLTLDASDHARAGAVELVVERGQARFEETTLVALPSIAETIETSVD